MQCNVGKTDRAIRMIAGIVVNGTPNPGPVPGGLSVKS